MLPCDNGPQEYTIAEKDREDYMPGYMSLHITTVTPRFIVVLGSQVGFLC